MNSFKNSKASIIKFFVTPLKVAGTSVLFTFCICMDFFSDYREVQSKVQGRKGIGRRLPVQSQSAETSVLLDILFTFLSIWLQKLNIFTISYLIVIGAKRQLHLL